MLPAQSEHLQPENTSGGFRLHTLPNCERLLGQTLALFETALHQSPHALKSCDEANLERFLALFHQAGVLVDLCVLPGELTRAR